MGVLPLKAFLTHSVCNAWPQHLKRVNKLLSLGNVFEHFKQFSAGSIGMGMFVSGCFEVGVFVDVFVSPGIEGAGIVLI